MGTYIIRDVFNLLRERWRKGNAMKRYGVWADHHVAQMKPEVKGDWVCYTDAQATVEALQAQVKELEGNRVPHSMQHVIELQAMNNRLGAEVEALQRENACKDTLIETLQAQLAQRGKDGGNE